MPEDRRLAAIMFTDIIGYTALMGSDEDGASERYVIDDVRYVIYDFWLRSIK